MDEASDGDGEARTTRSGSRGLGFFDAFGLEPDAGFVVLERPADVDRLLDICRQLRHWARLG